MKKLIAALFWISLAAFMLLGAIVVFGQLLGAIVQQPAWMLALDETPSTLAFVMSTICALSAFVLQYLPKSADTSANPSEAAEE